MFERRSRARLRLLSCRDLGQVRRAEQDGRQARRAVSIGRATERLIATLASLADRGFLPRYRGRGGNRSWASRGGNRPRNLGHFRVETDPEARRKPAPGFCFWRVAGRLRSTSWRASVATRSPSAPFPSPRAERYAAPLIRAAAWMGQAAPVVEDPHDAMKVLRSRARIEFEPVQRFQHELPFHSAVAPLPALLALPQAKPGTRGQGGEPMQILLAPKDLRKPDDLLDRNLLLGRALCEHLAPIIRRECGVWALARCVIHQDFIQGIVVQFSARGNIGLTSIYPRQKARKHGFVVNLLRATIAWPTGVDHPRPRGLCCASCGIEGVTPSKATSPESVRPPVGSPHTFYRIRRPYPRRKERHALTLPHSGPLAIARPWPHASSPQTLTAALASVRVGPT